MTIQIVEDLFKNKRGYYREDTLPTTIGNAIYHFGNNEIKKVLYFIDSSQDLDGSEGIIFTDQALFFKLNQINHYLYQDIQTLKLRKDHLHYIGYINDLEIDHKYCLELMTCLSQICDKQMIIDMNDHEKIGYYASIVLDDIKNDMFEDVVLSNKQYLTLKELYDNLDLIYTYENQEYYLELESYLTQAINYFDELEIDSEEIDELIKIKESFDQKSDEYMNQAKNYYDDMMNKYRNGDTSMLDQMKSMMNMLGIKEEDLMGKSQDEIEEFLCHKFHISKDQLNKMKSKMGM